MQLFSERSFENFLSSHSKKDLRMLGYRPSSVLALLFHLYGEPHLLLTVRNHKVRHHKGEVCFPGGVFEPHDQDLAQTALRETHEELNIAPDQIKILGELDDVVTPTQFCISPFVGWMNDKPVFEINFEEMSEVLMVPLSFFLDQENLRFEMREHQSQLHRMPYYLWNNYRIWGATARIVYQLVEKIAEFLPLHLDKTQTAFLKSIETSCSEPHGVFDSH